GTSDAIKNYEDRLRAMKGITEEVANKQMKSFHNQIVALYNQVKVASIEIGESLAPALLWLREVVSSSIDYWRQLPPLVKNTVVVVAALVAAAGPAIIVLGNIAWAFG